MTNGLVKHSRRGLQLIKRDNGINSPFRFSLHIDSATW